jgi:hypothetical protein
MYLKWPLKKGDLLNEEKRTQKRTIETSVLGRAHMNVGKSEKAQASCRKKKLRPHQAALLLTVFLWGWGSYVAKGKTYVPWSNHYVHKPISWIDDHPRIWAIYQDMTMAHMGFCKLMFIRFISQSLVSLYSHIPLTPPGSSGKSWTANLLNNTIPTDAKQ